MPETMDWFERHADRANPEAFIRTDPTYFASECADAIVAGRLTTHPEAAPNAGALVERITAYINWIAMTARFKGDDGREAAKRARAVKATLSAASPTLPVIDVDTARDRTWP